MNNGETRAYSAALIDGEGTIGLARQVNRRTGKIRYFPRVTAGNTARELIAFLQKHWRGDVGERYRSPQRKKIYEWRVLRAEAKEFLRQIEPYLIAKREQARLVLSCPLGKSGRDTTPSEYQKMEDIHKKITILNRRGRRAEQLQMELREQLQPALFDF